MKIVEVYIDGFKNIKKTRLNLSNQPVIVLLAKNSCGKSNLLMGIQYGFDLIATQGAQTRAIIEDADNYANWYVNVGECDTFTFGVRFSVENEGVYHYQYSLGYKYIKVGSADFDFDISHEKPIAHGILSEFLTHTTKDGESPKILFQRCEKNPSDIFIDPNDENIPLSHTTKESDFRFNLGLHMLGNMAIVDKKNEDDGINKILRNIFTVFDSLTVESIGDIICDEKSEYLAHGALSQEAIMMAKEDAENKAKKISSEKYEEFKIRFASIFKYNDGANEINMELHKIGESDQFQIIYRIGGKARLARSLSYGTRRVFKLLSQVVNNKTPLISIEEIEIGLHPSLYNGLARNFMEVLSKTQESENQDAVIPRLIITSHAPGIVDAFENHLGAIYNSFQYDDDPRMTQFLKFNENGKAEVHKIIESCGSRAGEIIFDMYSSVSTKAIKKKYLDYLDFEYAEMELSINY